MDYENYEDMISHEDPEQYETYLDICCNWETMDDDEYEEKLDSLDDTMRELALESIDDQAIDW